MAPDELNGCDVIDLGCGAGVDCFIVSKLVGESGHVTGVDMTSEQVGKCKSMTSTDLTST